jgi:hypothetical protein
MADGPLNAKAGLSVGDFKAGVNEINRSMRVLSSEFKASAAALGDWSKDATGLEQRISFLNKAIDLQKGKVEALKGQMEAEARSGKETAASKAELTVKINKATEELNKMQHELGEDEKSLADVKQGSDDAGKSVKDLGENSQEAAGGMETLRSMAGGLFTALKVGLGAVLALAGAVVALTGVIGGLVFSTAKSADELNDLSLKTGITTTRLQELAYAGEQIGTSSETMTSSFSKLTRSMSSASDQFADYANKVGDAKAKGKEYDGVLGEQANAFDALGVNIVDSSGKFKTSEAVFTDVINALGKVEDPTLRDMYAMSLLGKSAMELNPLIKAGSGELARLSAEAHQVGAVMSDEDVTAFADFNDQMSGLKMGLQGTLGTLGGAFLPGFKSIFGQAGGYLKEFARIVKGSDGDIGKIVQGAAGLIQRIVKDIAKQAPSLLQSGLTIVKTIIQSIITTLPQLTPVAIQILLELVTFIVQNLPMIVDAGIHILLALVSGLAQALPVLIPEIAKVIPLINKIFVDNLPLLLTAAMQLITALALGLTDATPILTESIPPLVQALIQVLIANGPLLLQAGGIMVAAIAQGIGSMIWAIGEAAGKLFSQFLDSMNPNWGTNMENLMLVGYNIVRGVWQGILNAKAWFESQIKSFFDGIVKTAMNAIGAHSPADAFIPAGNSIPMGVLEGIKKSMPSLERELGAAMSGLARNYNIGVNAGLSGSASGGRGGVGGGQVINLGPINVDARGATDPRAVGQAVSDSVLGRLRAVGAA